MQLQIEEQIPISVKMFSNNYIFIPREIRDNLHWRAGDTLKVYATKKGIFINK
jgi:AbrB family looped-hinge helix DNA binding protein